MFCHPKRFPNQRLKIEEIEFSVNIRSEGGEPYLGIKKGIRGIIHNF
jgi:hypothetical protein